MADIFISYAREDREWVEKLANSLVAEGFTVWWDWDLLVGKRYRETIETELQTAKAAVVVWSQHSIRSDFVRDEAEDAQQRNILLPLLKEIVRPPAGFRQLQTADLSHWQGDGAHIEFRRMMKGVSSLVGRPATGDTGVIRVDPEHPTTHFQETAPAAPALIEPTLAVAPPIDSPPAVEAKAPEPQPASPPPSAVDLAPPSPVVQAPVSPTLVSPVQAAPASKTNPILVAAALGIVVLLALIYLATQFFGSSTTPPPKPVTAGTGATPPHVGPPPAGMRPEPPVTPPPAGDNAGGANGDETGGDVGQTGPQAPDAHPTNNNGTDQSGGDTGQGNTH